jgi:hypothetical protein
MKRGARLQLLSHQDMPPCAGSLMSVQLLSSWTRKACSKTAVSVQRALQERHALTHNQASMLYTSSRAGWMQGDLSVRGATSSDVHSCFASESAG